MMRRILSATVFSVLLLGATSAIAGIEPPHDSSNGIDCLDCHALHEGTLGISKARNTDQELLCKSCHNPTGQASTMSDIGLHSVNGGATIVDCGSCHSVHFPATVTDSHPGGQTAQNLYLIRGDTAKYVPGAVEPAVFQVAPDHFQFAAGNAPYNGICQTCHQNTAYYRNDGTGNQTHNAGTDCSSCHAHKGGFPGNCKTCHSMAQDNGDGIPATGRRGLSSEFVNGPVHAHSMGGAIEASDCGTCHDVSTHANGNVELKDPDGGALFSFVSPADYYASGEPLKLAQFCGNCHDANGATAAGGLDPFGSGIAPPVVSEYFASGHADTAAEAFNHWTGTVQASCAKCHSENGFLDFLGADGSAAGTIDNANVTGSVISCMACHNSATPTLTSVTFPSGVEVTGLGMEAVCMQCHQGRSSSPTVDTYIAGKAIVGDDTPDAALGFQNAHYFAAGATFYGGITKGAYQYAGQTYDVRNRHVDSMDTCQECHNQHSGEIRLTQCAACHTGVTDLASLADVRMFGSTGDYDGDGNTSEGMEHEVDGVAAILMDTIKAYALEIGGVALVYDGGAYPYCFVDDNGDGIHDPTETTKYNAFTNRLVKAAYNYQWYMKDPGGYAHHPKYLIEVLHDSINDLNSALAAPMAFTGDRRDAGHFAGADEVFRHWDNTGVVSSSCSKCHSGEGFVNYVTTGTMIEVEASNGLECATCHDDVQSFSLRSVANATYPGGAVIVEPNGDDNLCTTCHSGRESKASVDAAIASGKPAFKNVHYLPAGAVLNGSDAGVGYQYDGKTYRAKQTHVGGVSCVGCHAPETTEHSFDVHDNAAACQACHGAIALTDIRLTSNADYDGDGSNTEPLEGELAGLEDALYAAIQATAAATGKYIVYSGSSYPYFFADTNANGVLDPSEANGGNSYKGWTAALSKAAFNFQLAHKEPGAWAHNFKYTAQLLYDSIEDLGGSTTGLVRP